MRHVAFIATICVFVMPHVPAGTPDCVVTLTVKTLIAMHVSSAGRLRTHHQQGCAGLQQGVVSTGNSLDFVEEDMNVMQQGNAAVKDMESAAVAYVCRLWAKPMLAIKAVTDIVDGDKAAQEEFLENLHKASKALQEVISRVLRYIDGKSLSEL